MPPGEEPESSNAHAPRARLTTRALLDLRALLSHLEAKAAPAPTPTEGPHEQPGPAKAVDEGDPDPCGTVHHG